MAPIQYLCGVTQPTDAQVDLAGCHLIAMLGGQSTALLATCDASVRVFGLDGASIEVPSHSVYGGGAEATTARWYPNGRLLAVALTSGVVAFHHHEALDVIGHFNAAGGGKAVRATVTCVDVTGGSRFLAAGTDGGALNIWDMKTSNAVNMFNVKGSVSAVAFQHTPDSRYVACTTGSEVLLFSRASNRLVDTFTVAPIDSKSSSPSRSRPKVTALAFSPHAVSLLAVTDDTGCVNVWDISRTRGGADRATIGTDATFSRFSSTLRVAATSIAFSGSTSSVGMLVGSLDKHVRVYDKLLRRQLFTFTAPSPVTCVAYCWDDVHVATGHSGGDATLFKVDFTGKSARIFTTIPATTERGTQLSTAMRSLQFQPKLSAITDAPKFTRAASGALVGAGTSNRSALRAQRSNTTPATLSSMLLNLPERSADDTLPRHNPRDSELFSPVAGGRGSTLRTPASAPVVRDLNEEYGQTTEANGQFSRAVDRRMSDIIPLSDSGQFARLEESAMEGDSKSIIDGDVVDSLLFSPPGEPKYAASSSTPVIPTPQAAMDEDSKTGGNVPRGMAFRRIRKSASEMTPKSLQLPPRPPPRSSTVPVVERVEDTAASAEAETAAGNGDDSARRQVLEAQKRVEQSPWVKAMGQTKNSNLITETESLADIVRQTVMGEVDAMREDLRSDILNIHTELVLSSSRQTQAIEQMFMHRDKLLHELRDEIAELRRENARLKRNQ